MDLPKVGLVDDFERRLEKMVEGAFSKAFRSDVEPSEIGRRLLREMEGGKSISVSAVYVPNCYLIDLSSEDFARFEGLMPTLKEEFAELLKKNARQRRWRPAGPLIVDFEQSDSVKTGQFEVAASHEAGAQDAERGTCWVELVDGNPPGKWNLDSAELTIGRAPACDITVSDPNASRTHARIFQRDQEWWVADAGSTNGTLVNDALVKERRLTSGDRIKVGATQLQYVESDEV